MSSLPPCAAIVPWSTMPLAASSVPMPESVVPRSTVRVPPPGAGRRRSPRSMRYRPRCCRDRRGRPLPAWIAAPALARTRPATASAPASWSLVPAPEACTGPYRVAAPAFSVASRGKDEAAAVASCRPAAAPVLNAPIRVVLPRTLRRPNCPARSRLGRRRASRSGSPVVAAGRHGWPGWRRCECPASWPRCSRPRLHPAAKHRRRASTYRR